MKLVLIETLIFEGMFNFIATKDSKSPHNKFKDYIEGLYTEVDKLEESFNNEIKENHFSEFSSLDSSDLSTTSDNVYANIISRINDFSIPILLKKELIKSEDVTAKYYYLYPDFPDVIFIRTALKPIVNKRYKWTTTTDIMKVHMNIGNNKSKLAIINQEISDNPDVNKN